MQFSKKDIKPGQVVVLRNGQNRRVTEGMMLVCDPGCGAKYAVGPALYLDEYCDRMLHSFPTYDIMAVWDADTGPLWWRSSI